MVNSRTDAELLKLSALIGGLLREKGLKLGLAESCTGGLVSYLITTVAGSSDYFTGAVVAYDNSVKTTLLGVDPEILAKSGAVSAIVARRMSVNAKNALKTDLGISITGIAGPGGGSAKKPVGLVYISLAFGAKTVVKRCMFKGTRSEVQSQAAKSALKMLYERLKGRANKGRN